MPEWASPWPGKVGWGEIVKDSPELSALLHGRNKQHSSRNLECYHEDSGALKPSKLESIILTSFVSFQKKRKKKKKEFSSGPRARR